LPTSVKTEMTQSRYGIRIRDVDVGPCQVLRHFQRSWKVYFFRL